MMTLQWRHLQEMYEWQPNFNGCDIIIIVYILWMVCVNVLYIILEAWMIKIACRKNAYIVFYSNNKFLIKENNWKSAQGRVDSPLYDFNGYYIEMIIQKMSFLILKIIVQRKSAYERFLNTYFSRVKSNAILFIRNHTLNSFIFSSKMVAKIYIQHRYDSCGSWRTSGTWGAAIATKTSLGNITI